MKKSGGLSRDILLSWKSTSGKSGHFRTETKYIAAERRVARVTTGAVRRLWGLLPPRVVEPKPEYLEIPEGITTEEELRAFVKKERRLWMDGGR